MPDAGPRPPDPSEESIRDPLLIDCLLRRAAAERSLVAVRLPGPQAGMTLILGIDRESGELLIDQLAPPEADEALRRTGRLRARIRVNGAEAEFEAEVAGRREAPGGATYRLPLPSEIRYRQRRGHHRVPVPRDLAVAVRYVLGGIEAEGRLCDVSLGGIGLETAAAGADGLAPGETIERCALLLPDRSTVAGPLEVCYVAEPAPNGAVRFGGRFTALDPRDRRRLQRFVAALERDYVRRRSPGTR